MTGHTIRAVAPIATLSLVLAAAGPAPAPPGAVDDPALRAVQQTARQHIDGPATVVLDGAEAAGERADEMAHVLEALGESPVAALLDALGDDVKAYNAHVVTLSNPFFEGRAPGLNGNRVAADYIEFYFREAGLQPAFPTETRAADGAVVLTPNSSYRQPFSPHQEVVVARQDLAASFGDGQALYAPERDYTVLGFSGSGQVEAPLAFVGYSIADGEDGYTSYPDGADLDGKVALMLRFEPMDERGRSRWADAGWSPEAALVTKLDAAVERGAAAIILVNPPGADDRRAGQLMTTRGSANQGTPRMPVPVVMLSTEAADGLVRAADGEGRSLMDLRRLADERGGVVDLDATVSLDVAVGREPVMTDNVGGVLPGRGDLADQYIIIGAHYDHVGYGYFGSRPENAGQLHPGADDNASGTSGLLLLADLLSRAYRDLPADASARSVLFLGFSAEESGLHGSRYFVQHPTITKSQMYLMVNLDMIGRLRRNTVTAEGVQTARGMLEWLKPYFDASGLTVATGGNVPPNSDHFNFYQHEVPVLFFFTGLHRQYHTPADVGSLINQLGAVRVVHLVRDVVLAAAQRREPLVFEAPQRGHGLAAAVSPGRARVRLGIAPASYADDGPGIGVGDVYEGTAAYEAGLKVGDRLMKWNGQELTTVEAWMPILAAHKPGDEVEIVFIRDGREMTTRAVLKARDQGGR